MKMRAPAKEMRAPAVGRRYVARSLRHVDGDVDLLDGDVVERILAATQEVACLLGEQGIGQHVLLRAGVLRDLLTQARHRGFDQVGRTAGDDLVVADDLAADLLRDGHGRTARTGRARSP